MDGLQAALATWGRPLPITAAVTSLCAYEMVEFRIGRLVTRWHLGERLARVERAPGKN